MMAAAGVPREHGQSARAAGCGRQSTDLLVPSKARVWSTLEFIAYRYLTIAARSSPRAEWSRPIVWAALTGS